jgi:hypothetical protein
MHTLALLIILQTRTLQKTTTDFNPSGQLNQRKDMNTIEKY